MRVARAALVALLLGVSPAYADEPPAAPHAEQDTAARAAYLEGARHFDLAEYQAALESFKRSYQLSGAPALLYNIGQCHLHLGQRAEALHFYRTYLQLSPDTTDRAQVERLIVTLEAPAPSATPPPHRSRAPWLIAGAVLLVVAGVAAALAVALVPRDAPMLDHAVQVHFP
jgi:tetratricopeptide (TPR) repeat protein